MPVVKTTCHKEKYMKNKQVKKGCLQKAKADELDSS
jgi:hypothetical protein